MDDVGNEPEDSATIGPISNKADQSLPDMPLVPLHSAGHLTPRAEFWLIFTGIMIACLAAYGTAFLLIRLIIRAVW